MTRADKPCMHIEIVQAVAHSVEVEFTIISQTTEVHISCAKCDIYVVAYETIAPGDIS